MKLLMVFLGGGLGSLCRYSIARWLSPLETALPYATFLANLVSCVLLGALVSYELKHGMPQSIRLLLITGFCGGFSTFSTFSYETFALFQAGDYTNALTNIVGSLAICLLGIWLGLKLVG